jgi:hypothetical protein
VVKPYSISKPDPHGWGYVSLRSDHKIIGRVMREGKSWAGRHYFHGGGDTRGGFPTRTAAAEHVYARELEPRLKGSTV